MTVPEWICDRCGWPIPGGCCTCPDEVDALRLWRVVQTRHREAVRKARQGARRAA